MAGALGALVLLMFVNHTQTVNLKTSGIESTPNLDLVIDLPQMLLVPDVAEPQFTGLLAAEACSMGVSLDPFFETLIAVDSSETVLTDNWVFGHGHDLSADDTRGI